MSYMLIVLYIFSIPATTTAPAQISGVSPINIATYKTSTDCINAGNAAIASDPVPKLQIGFQCIPVPAQ